MSKLVIFCLPDHDEGNRWGSEWLKSLKSLAEDEGFKVTILSRDDANRQNVLQNCRDKDFIYFTGIGHGNETIYTGQNNEYIFWKEDSETCEVSKNHHFNFLSCRCCTELIPWMVHNCGAKAIHGYKKDYIFMIDEDNFPNDIAEPFFDSHITIDKELLKGSTHSKAHTECRKRYLYWIRNPPGVDPYLQSWIKIFLVWNMMSKCLYGGRFSSIKKDEGCFIITATAGFESKELFEYYWFRNNILRKSHIGRYFIKMYYDYSPILANVISSHYSLRKIIYTIFVKPISRIIKNIRLLKYY